MKYPIVLSGLLALSTLASCSKKEDPIIPNEEELITTVNLTFSSEDDTVIFRFQDLDGPGGNDPIIVNGSLIPNKVYEGSIELLNEIENPAEEITEEVKDEAEEHQFFYILSDSQLGQIDYTDQDMDGFPIGLSTVWSTLNSTTGKLTVVLKHEPIKNASGVSDGDMTNAGGETDIEVEFDVTIQ